MKKDSHTYKYGFNSLFGKRFGLYKTSEGTHKRIGAYEMEPVVSAVL